MKRKRFNFGQFSDFERDIVQGVSKNKINAQIAQLIGESNYIIKWKIPKAISMEDAINLFSLEDIQ